MDCKNSTVRFINVKKTSTATSIEPLEHKLKIAKINAITAPTIKVVTIFSPVKTVFSSFPQEL